MIHFYSHIPYNLGWPVLGFTSVFLYQIFNYYYKLFGIMTVSTIIIVLLLLLLFGSLHYSIRLSVFDVCWTFSSSVVRNSLYLLLTCLNLVEY